LITRASLFVTIFDYITPADAAMQSAVFISRSAMRISVEDELAWLRYTVQRHREQAAQVQP
jgi:hypothetical protein